MAIADNLIAHWKLNESSGPAVDAHGSNDLSWNGTIGAVAGKIGNAINFNANGEYLAIADNADLSMGNIDCSFSLWVYFDVAGSGAVGYAIAKARSSGDREYYIRKDAGDVMRFATFGPSSSKSVVSTVALSTATWYFVQAWHDASTDEIGIRVDDSESFQTESHSDGIRDSGNNFRIGQTHNVSLSSQWYGRIDSASVWKRRLSSDEFDHMYNSGSGQDYPFPELSADGVAGPDGDLRGGGEPKIFQQPYIIVP
jgi:hypothetical protein